MTVANGGISTGVPSYYFEPFEVRRGFFRRRTEYAWRLRSRFNGRIVGWSGESMVNQADRDAIILSMSKESGWPIREPMPEPVI